MRSVVVAAAASVLAMAVVGAPARAAVPERVSFQARLTDAGGLPTEGVKPVVFAIYDVAADGTALWTEPQDVTCADGYLSVLLGSVTAFPEDLFDGPRWLGITVDTDEEMGPRFELASAPYALRAKVADSVVSDVTTGTAPFTVESTTLVDNLNADMVDGQHASDLANADMVDGQHASDLALASHVHFPTAWHGYTSDTVGASAIYVYPGPAFTPSTNKRALVTVNVAINGTETTNGPYMRVARKSGTSDGNDNSFGFYFAPTPNSSGYSTMSRTAYFDLSAGTSYQLGAYISGSTAWSGNTVYVRCTYMLFDR